MQLQSEDLTLASLARFGRVILAQPSSNLWRNLQHQPHGSQSLTNMWRNRHCTRTNATYSIAAGALLFSEAKPPSARLETLGLINLVSSSFVVIIVRVLVYQYHFNSINVNPFLPAGVAVFVSRLSISDWSFSLFSDSSPIRSTETCARDRFETLFNPELQPDCPSLFSQLRPWPAKLPKNGLVFASSQESWLNHAR